jgi:hypothetical protein
MDTLFLTTISEEVISAVHLLVESLRAFGGDLAGSQFWIFTTDLKLSYGREDDRTRLLPLVVPAPVAAYPFGRKVAACAQAEQLVPDGTRSLVWIDSSCLIVQPPIFFDLGAAFDAAFRPVHIRNVGLSPAEPLDAFWQGIYTVLGVNDISTMITSFMDEQRLRTYFNSHAFSVNPALGLMRRWYEIFQHLVNDRQFQEVACRDDRYKIFLFQALLSALIASSLEPTRVRILPPTYNYPYNLHDRVPPNQRAVLLDELVCFTYEDRKIHPNALIDIQVHEPLRAWLEARLSFTV